MTHAARIAAMRLDDAARRCEEAAHYLSQAESRARAWVEQMVSGVRTSDNATRVGAKTRPQGPSPPSSGQPDSFEPVARGILERLPVRKSGDKTHGKWINADGEEEDLISGYDDDSADVKRFMEEHNIMVAPGPDTLGSHVEVKFAMRMRRDGLTNETITINNRPCPGPYGCHRNLWKFLPDGARLTVYGPDGFKRTYPE